MSGEHADFERQDATSSLNMGAISERKKSLHQIITNHNMEQEQVRLQAASVRNELLAQHSTVDACA